MSTHKLIIRKNRLNKNGHTTVYIQYIHNSIPALISTQVKVNPEDLNFVDSEQRGIDPIRPIKKSAASSTSKTSKINKSLIDLDTAINRLIISRIDPTVEEVKSELSKSKEQNTTLKKNNHLVDIYSEYLVSMKDTLGPGTLRQKKVSFKKFESYCHFLKKNIKPEDINLKFYDGYIKFLQGKDLTNNTIGGHIKNLKAFLNYIKKRGHNVGDLSEFKVFKEKPDSITYLSQDELNQLWRYDFKNNTRLEKVRDIFILGCQTGLRISDLKRLNLSHIQDGKIKIRTHKNKGSAYIRLTPISHEILTKYEFKLPIISEQRINDYIKEACEEAKIDTPVEKVTFKKGRKIYKTTPKYKLVSTHMAVKTFITHALEKGVSPNSVARITGKTVKVILDHYYGSTEDIIDMEMERAFGVPNLKLA